MDFQTVLIIYQIIMAGLMLWSANNLRKKKEYIGTVGAVLFFLAILIGLFK